jgi:uncharacterized membrane protein
VIRTRRSITIDRPAEEVFGYLAHFENGMEWRSELRQIQRLTQQAEGPGARYRERFDWGGIEGADTLEVTGFEPNRRVTFVAEGDIRILGEYRVFPLEGGHTTVDIVAEMEPEGALKDAEPAIREAYNRQGESDLEHLKDILEHRQAWRAQSR